VLLLPQVAPSAADTPASPRRSLPPGSHVTTWLQWQGFVTPAWRVVVHQHRRWRRRSRPRWRVGCCRVSIPGLVASARWLEVALRLGGAPAARCSPHEAAPTPEPPVQASGCMALGPVPAPGEGWPTLRRVGAWLLRVRRVVPVIGRRWRGDAVPALGRNCSRPKPRRHCICT
jgi:hypothetical protein